MPSQCFIGTNRHDLALKSFRLDLDTSTTLASNILEFVDNINLFKTGDKQILNGNSMRPTLHIKVEKLQKMKQRKNVFKIVG